jgi:hypothetical protein
MLSSFYWNLEVIMVPTPFPRLILPESRILALPHTTRSRKPCLAQPSPLRVHCKTLYPHVEIFKLAGLQGRGQNGKIRLVPKPT